MKNIKIKGLHQSNHLITITKCNKMIFLNTFILFEVHIIIFNKPCGLELMYCIFDILSYTNYKKCIDKNHFYFQ